MDTEIKNALKAADKEAQYDEKAKRILGNKYILANIMICTIDEFKGMCPREVVSYIEGEPYISTIPVEPGLTNKDKEGQRVTGFNTESTEINEGIIRFDIIFYVRLKDGIAQIIVNIEMQKNLPNKYKLLNRAVFYVCRLISSQKERDFVNTNYDDIKQVYSIWICTNMKENSMKYVRLAGENILGEDCWEGGTDLLNIVMIGLSNELPEHDEKYQLHRLLGALLSSKLDVQKKLNIINSEYEVPIETNIRKEVDSMCNLGQGIREQGWIEGRIEGRREGAAEIIMNMYQKGFSLEQIADIVNRTTEEVSKIIEHSKMIRS